MKTIPENYQIIGLKGAIESFEMHDPFGNACASALFRTGPSDFEVYFWDFNSTIPRRVTGTLRECKYAMNFFFDVKIEEGFIQPMADENGKAVVS